MRIQVHPRSAFLLGAGVFAAIQLAVHLKNYVQVGYFFLVVNGDVWDAAYRVIGAHCLIVSALLAVLFWGVHDYPYYLIIEVIPLILNALLYGSVAWMAAQSLSR